MPRNDESNGEVTTQVAEAGTADRGPASSRRGPREFQMDPPEDVRDDSDTGGLPLRRAQPNAGTLGAEPNENETTNFLTAEERPEARRHSPRRARLVLPEEGQPGPGQTARHAARPILRTGTVRARGRGRGAPPPRTTSARPLPDVARRTRVTIQNRRAPADATLPEAAEARPTSPAALNSSCWSRPSPNNDDWMVEDYEDDSADLLVMTSPGAAAAGARTGPRGQTWPNRSPASGPAISQAPPPQAAERVNHHPDPQGIGLFRAARERLPLGLAQMRPPTAAELNAITVEGLCILFDPRRVAEITRARGVAEDVKAAQALKAQQTLAGRGWAHSSLDADHHSIFFGPQVVFRQGQSPAVIGQLLQWAVPFAVDVPGDVSKTQEWSALLDAAATLLPLLEAEILNCRQGFREFNLPATILSQGRALAEAFFVLRAKVLIPMMALLGTSPLEEQAKTAVRGYVHQAVTLPKAWQYVEDMIASGIFRQHAQDPALKENAARTALLRPFLTSFLQGQIRDWDTSDMVSTYLEHRPSATLLYSTNLGNLAQTNPAAAALAASFHAPSLPPPQPRLPASNPARMIPPLPFPAPLYSTITGPATPALLPAPGGGPLTHPAFFSGEYVVPPGWLPPPVARPPTKERTATSSKLCIPAARSIIGASSPFTITSAHPCDYCALPGHAQYECPKRFSDQFGRALPGFTASGAPDPAAWANGDLIPAARRDMAAYLVTSGVLAHRRFRVTTDHIATGTAPPPPTD